MNLGAFPAQIQDCKAAIRFLRAKANDYELNGGKIAVMGHSAGGHLAALTGLANGVEEFEADGDNRDQSSRVQAVVVLSGPTELRVYERLAALNAKCMNYPIADYLFSGPNSCTQMLLGGPVELNLEKAAKASPTSYVSQDDPPVMIVSGFRDLMVPPSKRSFCIACSSKPTSIRSCCFCRVYTTTYSRNARTDGLSIFWCRGWGWARSSRPGAANRRAGGAPGAVRQTRLESKLWNASSQSTPPRLRPAMQYRRTVWAYRLRAIGGQSHAPRAQLWDSPQRVLCRFGNAAPKTLSATLCDLRGENSSSASGYGSIDFQSRLASSTCSIRASSVWRSW